MIVSVVERQTWKRCRRRWDLTADTRQNWTPKANAPALQLGGMVQEALSEWTEDPTIDPVGSFARLSGEAIDYAKKQYRESIGAAISQVEVDKLYETVELGMAMVTNYRDYYKTPLPEGYRIIQTEQRVLIAIPNTEHWECNKCGKVYPEALQLVNAVWTDKSVTTVCTKCGEASVTWQPHYLRATMDSLVQHITTGKILPIERKTYGQRPNATKLLHDDQMLLYIWALTQLFPPEQLGGILYDGLWKRAKPPKSKQSNGRPTDVTDLFYRDIFIRPPAELAECEVMLAKEVADMVNAIENDLMYINRPWDGCMWDCPVEKICSAMSRGEDVDYVIETYYRQRTFPMVAPADEDDD